MILNFVPVNLLQQYDVGHKSVTLGNMTLLAFVPKDCEMPVECEVILVNKEAKKKVYSVS